MLRFIRRAWIDWNYQFVAISGILSYVLRFETKFRNARFDTMKKASLKEGQLAPRNVPMVPWSEVHVDEIGPWEYKVNGLTVKVRALTMIDPVTNLVEIV